MLSALGNDELGKEALNKLSFGNVNNEFVSVLSEKETAELVYIEIDDMYKTNEIIKNVISIIGSEISYNIVPPESGCQGYLGITTVVENWQNFDIEEFCKIQNVVYVLKEQF